MPVWTNGSCAKSVRIEASIAGDRSAISRRDAHPGSKAWIDLPRRQALFLDVHLERLRLPAVGRARREAVGRGGPALEASGKPGLDLGDDSVETVEASGAGR